MTQPNSPFESSLHCAAREGNLAELERLIALGADVNSRMDWGKNYSPFLNQLTPLMVAAASGDRATVETLRWLVEHGADVYAKSAGGTTAAWYAAGSGGELEVNKRVFDSHYADRLEYLLDVGLNPQECSDNGRSLLIEACKAGDPIRVSLLLQRGAKVAQLSSSAEKLMYFQIPLFCAAQSGSAECVRLILAAGADPNMRDDLNCTAIMYAQSSDAALELINAGTDIYAIDEYGYDALQTILQRVDRDRFEVARVLLQSGADIERRNEYDWTRLYLAFFDWAEDTVEFLLNCGANPHAQQGEGKTLLHAVCWASDCDNSQQTNQKIVRLIDLLVSTGIDVNARDAKGNTPMHEAAGGDGGNLTAMCALLKHGANPDLAAEDGMTPLLLAASNGEIECLRAALAAGAKPTRTDKKGMTAVDHAKKHYNTLVSTNSESPNSDSCCEEDLKQALEQSYECLKLLQQTNQLAD
jgi:ankyrin repeat protein